MSCRSLLKKHFARGMIGSRMSSHFGNHRIQCSRMDEPVRDSSQVLIVTGSSRGIGAATVRLAARRGYSVCVNYRRGDREAGEVVSAIQQEGGRAIAVRADISSEPDVIRLFETV